MKGMSKRMQYTHSGYTVPGYCGTDVMHAVESITRRQKPNSQRIAKSHQITSPV
jgi:hypothetical protein